jgi:lysozyme
MNRTALKALLVHHEGLKLKPYKDTTGRLTIGVGRNLTDDGITEDEARLLLDNDINEVWHECSTKITGFTALDDTRQHVLMDMVFNMGLGNVMLFTKMLNAIQARDFTLAADEMLQSRWAKQVGDRALDLARMMRTDT